MNFSTLLGLLFVTAGSTLLGSLPVAFHHYLQKENWKFWESFGGGVMISASFFSLFLPAYRMLKDFDLSLRPLFEGGIAGIIFIIFTHVFLRLLTVNAAHRRAYLVVFALAIHNVPEGLAVGVDTAALGWHESLPLNIAIFIQNLPEGFVSSLSFLISGFSLPLSLAANAVTAIIEGASALGGYHFVSHSSVGLPLMLSFSGGCMTSVVLTEFFDRVRMREAANFSVSGFVVGLSVCAVLDFLL